MGGVSPCMPNTQARAAALTTALETARIGEVEVFIAMRYWYPRARDTARRVAAYRPDQVILLPLYPQYSTTTTASSIKEREREAKAVGLAAPTSAVCCYPAAVGFISAWVEGSRGARAEERGGG